MKDKNIGEVLRGEGEEASESVHLVASKRIDSAVPELRPGEPGTVFLDPAQVEEIHADDYSLLLFSATRIKPLSIDEIKQQFPEPISGKAQSVLNRFVAVGLAHFTKNQKYYSNYPHDYVNWGKYRYEADIEAKKDAKVFQLVKDFFGVKEYWKNKSYFSIDAFFTREQSEELREMFMQIKVKAKQYANENAKAGNLSNLKFRRVKFYDMIFGLLVALTVSLGTIDSSYAQGGSGTDPVRFRSSQDIELMFAGGSGNDPSRNDESQCFSGFDLALIKVMDREGGGGGHDPGTRNSEDSCKLGTLLVFVRQCRGLSNQFCSDVRNQSLEIWHNLKTRSREWSI